MRVKVKCEDTHEVGAVYYDYCCFFIITTIVIVVTITSLLLYLYDYRQHSDYEIFMHVPK